MRRALLDGPRYEGRPLRAVILYRDAQHAGLGKTYFTWLSGNLPPARSLNVIEWKFDTIAFAPMSSLAKLDVQAASIFVICTRADEDLPQNVRELAQAVPKGAFRVVVILLTSVPSETSRVYRDYAFLREQTLEDGNVMVMYSNGEPTERTFDFDRTSPRQVIGVREISGEWNEALWLAGSSGNARGVTAASIG